MDKHVPFDFREELNNFIDTQIAAGRYKSASDVIGAIHKLLQEREEKLAALRVALDEGEASGFAEPFGIEDFIAEMREEKKQAAG